VKINKLLKPCKLLYFYDINENQMYVYFLFFSKKSAIHQLPENATLANIFDLSLSKAGQNNI
jgi:hypothetical protein